MDLKLKITNITQYTPSLVLSDFLKSKYLKNIEFKICEPSNDFKLIPVSRLLTRGTPPYFFYDDLLIVHEDRKLYLFIKFQMIKLFSFPTAIGFVGALCLYFLTKLGIFESLKIGGSLFFLFFSMSVFWTIDLFLRLRSVKFNTTTV